MPLELPQRGCLVPVGDPRCLPLALVVALVLVQGVFAIVQAVAGLIGGNYKVLESNSFGRLLELAEGWVVAETVDRWAVVDR